jgi:hypothetical protein
MEENRNSSGPAGSGYRLHSNPAATEYGERPAGDEAAARRTRAECGRPEDDRQGRERLDLLTRQQADLQAGLDTLRVEFQSVNGRLEDMARVDPK